MTPVRLNRLALLLLFPLLAACGRAAPSEDNGPAVTPSAHVQLSERVTFTDFDYSMAHPAGWLVARRGPATVISQLQEDHERAFEENPPPTKGYEVSLDHRSLDFMHELGLAQEPTLQQLFELNQAFFAWSNVSPPTRLEVFDAPALAIRAQGQGDWVYTLMGFAGDEAFLLAIEAPTEEALDDFLPTWEAMLASIQPAE